MTTVAASTTDRGLPPRARANVTITINGTVTLTVNVTVNGTVNSTNCCPANCTVVCPANCTRDAVTRPGAVACPANCTAANATRPGAVLCPANCTRSATANCTRPGPVNVTQTNVTTLAPRFWNSVAPWPQLPLGPAPLYWAGRSANDTSPAAQCANGTLTKKAAAGKVVICVWLDPVDSEHFFGSSGEVKRVGGVAMLLVNGPAAGGYVYATVGRARLFGKEDAWRAPTAFDARPDGLPAFRGPGLLEGAGSNVRPGCASVPSPVGALSPELRARTRGHCFAPGARALPAPPARPNSAPPPRSRKTTSPEREVPTVQFEADNAAGLLEFYLRNASRAVATIGAAAMSAFTSQEAPSTPGFSSRGPAYTDKAALLKPDISAPGGLIRLRSTGGGQAARGPPGRGRRQRGRPGWGAHARMRPGERASRARPREGAVA